MSDVKRCTKKRATIKDVAKLAKVSVGTVDRALHNRDGISSQTRSRVLQVAEALGYRVNRAASSLAGRPTRLAAIYPEHMVYFYRDIQRGLVSGAEGLQDFGVELIHLPIDQISNLSLELEAIDKAVELEVDGLILCPSHREVLDTQINRLIEQGIPVVTLSTDAPNSRRLTCVCTDPYQNGLLAGELLALFVGQGAKVAVLTGDLQVEDHLEKIRGFSKSFKQYRYDGQIVGVHENYDSEEKGYDVTQRLLRSYPDLQGMYISTANAVGPCQAVRDMGFKGRIRIVGTDVYPEMVSFLKDETMTAAIYQNPYLQGKRAVELLFDSIVNSTVIPKFSYIEPTVIVRSNLSHVLPGNHTR